MTVSRKSRQKVQFTLQLSVILTIAFFFSGCDNLVGQNDGSGTSGNGNLTYMSATTPLIQLVFEEYGLAGSAYNIKIVMYTDGINITDGSGSGKIITLDTFFGTNDVIAGFYSRSDTPTTSTFSNLSKIETVVNGTTTSSDRIMKENFAGGYFNIGVLPNGSYTIAGPLTTTAGSATFNYAGPVNLVRDYK